MKRALLFLLFQISLCSFAQRINLGVSKNLGWAEWTYETLEFKDDCTILKGYFVPLGSGCYVISKMDETLKADGQEYHIMYTTLPINRHPRTTYKGGCKVYFEEHFEPIFSIGGSVKLCNHDISFTVSFKTRKVTTPYENLLPEYEKHLDTLIVYGKYKLAAYHLNQYVTKVWRHCPTTAKKKIKDRITSKYKITDFFLNSGSDNGYILSLFEDMYSHLGIKVDDALLRKLNEINSLQINARLNLNGKNLSRVFHWCESLLSKIQEFGKYNKCYEDALSLYRKALYMDGQMQRIPELDKEIIDVYRHIYNISETQYLERLTNIASDLDVRPSNTKYESYVGINIWKEVRDKAKQKYPNSLRYATALKEIADYNRHYGHYDVALMQFLEIDSLCKTRREDFISEAWYNNDCLTDNQSKAYIDLIQMSISKSIGYCYYRKGDLSKAVEFDKNNPYYYCELGEIDTLTNLCEKFYGESIRGLKTLVREPTIISPGAYYDEIFDIAYTPALSSLIPYFAHITKSEKLCEMAYDGALVSKGFKLSAENRLRQYLKTTQDPISRVYSAQIEQEMTSYQSMIKNKNIDALEKRWEIVHLQRKLIAYLDSIGALEKAYFSTWKDVRKSLKEDELAIEFIEIPLWNQSKSIYVALTLRENYNSPHIVPIATNDCIDSLLNYNIYSNGLLYDIIWKPLKREFTNINKVFFSPIAKLHTLGIENASLPTCEHHLSHISFYRLSSTRELINANYNKEISNKAALFGGLRYALTKDPSKVNRSETDLYGNTNSGRIKQIRGSLDDISEETTIEIDSIAKILLRHEFTPSVYREQEGTEDSFKALSGKKMNIIHVSTHGFYWDEKQAEIKRTEKQIAFLDEISTVYSQEDRSLSRSGLLFSGSRWAFDGNEVAEGVEDGILTAREISKLDFDDVDLVSLSACQTGLGDLVSSEGVFGLQRGFKKAGAKSILMTLWEVDDTATRLFMTDFYRHYLSSGNKYQALKAAQQYLQNYVDNEGKNCYNYPRYWAAFILLDAI